MTNSNEKLPLLSVVVPVYKVEKYLVKCVESIVNQSYRNLEIILVDDGSPDQCPQICDEFSKRDTRIKVLHKSNGGLVSARKAGVRVATGDYIAYVDGDDWIKENLYMDLYEKGMKYGAEIVSCSGFIKYYSEEFEVTVKNSLEYGFYFSEEFEKKIFPYLINTNCFYNTEIPVSLCTHVFDAILLKKNQAQISDDIRMGEDLICVSFCFLEAKSVVLTDVCSYCYRLSSESMTQSDLIGEDDRIRKLYSQYLERISGSKYEQMFIKKLNFAIIFICLISNYKCLMSDKKAFLFPFSRVKRGKRIVIYGAGAFGKELIRYVKNNEGFSLVEWVDTAYIKYQEQNLNVQDPKNLLYMEFDYVVIAVTREKIARQICDSLERIGIKREKIEMIDFQAIVDMKNPLSLYR